MLTQTAPGAAAMAASKPSVPPASKPVRPTPADTDRPFSIWMRNRTSAAARGRFAISVGVQRFTEASQPPIVAALTRQSQRPGDGLFRKILIANRGEIACRIIKTARRMGIATVAVYSDADRDALHVEMADEAIAIGPAPAAQSYLQVERIVAAARDTGAEAVHPGYGFLSEREAFAVALEKAGIAFIGPNIRAIA